MNNIFKPIIQSIGRKEYERGYAESNKRLQPLIQKIHDCVYSEGQEKGYIEGFKDGYKTGSNETSQWADEIGKRNIGQIAVSEWYTPEQKLPPEDVFVLAVINGKHGHISYHDAYTLASYAGDEGWICECAPECESFEVKEWTKLPDAP